MRLSHGVYPRVARVKQRPFSLHVTYRHFLLSASQTGGPSALIFEGSVAVNANAHELFSITVDDRCASVVTASPWAGGGECCCSIKVSRSWLRASMSMARSGTFSTV